MVDGVKTYIYRNCAILHQNKTDKTDIHIHVCKIIHHIHILYIQITCLVNNFIKQRKLLAKKNEAELTEVTKSTNYRAKNIYFLIKFVFPTDEALCNILSVTI
jgi:hypothetical protein